MPLYYCNSLFFSTDRAVNLRNICDKFKHERHIYINCYFFSQQAELVDLRNNICQLLDNNAEIYYLVQKLQFTQCIYLLSVYRLETLRYFII